MNAIFVAPDYYEKRPKKCSAGWGTTFITVTPEGDVLPCQSAKIITGLEFPNVKNDSLNNIWEKSDLFNRFRGTSWMTEPCKSCPGERAGPRWLPLSSIHVDRGCLCH